MPFKTPIGYYREQIENLLDSGKKLTRNEIADKLPHIPPGIITGTLHRMQKDGDIKKEGQRGSRNMIYSTREHEPRRVEITIKVDNSELARHWNVAFEKADYADNHAD